MTILPAMQATSRKLLTCLHCHAVRQNRFAQTLSHYELLGLKDDASKKQIKEAFIKLSKRFHPDSATNGTNNHEHFVKINNAYTTLSSQESREAYDSTLARHMGQSAYGSSYERSSPQPGFQASDWNHGAPHVAVTEEELEQMLSQKHKTFWHGEDRTENKIPMYVHVTCFSIFAVLMGAVAASLSMYSKSVVRQKQQLAQEKRRNNSLRS